VSLIALIAALFFGLARFAQLRFSTGEIFPEYSTFNADPVGAKALYASLKQLDGFSIQRNLAPLERVPRNSQSTVVFLGMEPHGFDSAYEPARELARDGVRVVIAMDARHSRADSSRGMKVAMTPPPPAKGATNTNTIVRINLVEVLDVGVKMNSSTETNLLAATRSIDEPALPESLQWYGRYVFAPVTNTWTTVYAVNDEPVVLQRKYGLGSIVLIADSFPFSNEALRNNRSPGFLLWTFKNAIISFDETHLGVKQGSGIAVMMREYRMHGLAAGCMLLAALWIWRSSKPLVPPAPLSRLSGVETVEGKTAREAVVHLLRRNISEEEILRVSIDEWAKAHPAKEYWHAVRLEEARKYADAFGRLPKPRDLAAAQRELSSILFPKQT